MKIELLYPEIAGLYGESGDYRFLELLFKDYTVLKTNLTQRPAFIDDDEVKLVFIGPSSEQNQEKIIKALLPFRDDIKKAIDRNIYIIATGNALEVFGNKIIRDDKEEIECLGITETIAKTDLLKRYSCLFLGDMNLLNDNKLEIIGFKTSFTESKYGKNDKPLLTVKRGRALNINEKYEGVRINNFISTYLIGTFLIMNPLLVRYILDDLGLKNLEIPFFDELKEAYFVRLEEFKNQNTYHNE